jgi:coenzyme PQQ precursor peptide PqqA
MDQRTERTEQCPQPPVNETGWQTPEYVIVETALEVTAYSLASR